MVRLDIRYINEWSFRRDLAIIAKTVPVVFRGTGGY
jgi:lipopolysaccharide/colanic/teichoic acid biosynthesis glycosyltransferase